MESILVFVGTLVGGFIGFLIGKKLTSLQAQHTTSSQQEAVNLLNKELEYQQQKLKDTTDNLTQQLEESKKEQNLFTEKAKVEVEKLRSQKEEQIQELLKEKELLAVSLERSNAKTEELTTDLIQNKAEIEKLQEKFTKEFENLANKILEEKSKTFSNQNQKNINEILKPLQEKIQSFEKKVEDTNKEGIERNSSLRQQIESLKDLNQQMSKETINLTKALKGDSKTQGNWGELILERVLEKSGLEKGREYDVEQSFTTDEVEGKTRLRPDVIIHLPDNRKMIVDSKVSLTAYERYTNTDNDVDSNLALKEHVLSLHRHIEQLSAKKYEDLYKMESPEFVLLFIPIEPAFAIALDKDPQLYNKAFDKNIVIVTASTLLATLRTIETMWRNEKQQRNAIEIARQAGALYDKFDGLLKDLIGIGKKMDDTKKDYAAAMNKLTEGKGNLITSVQKLKNLGAKAKKTLPESLIQRASEE